MKIVQINVTCGSGSTGKICVAVSQLLTEKGIENYIIYSSGDSSYPLGIKYMTPLDIKLQALKSRILGNYGFNSKGATKRIIEKLKEISPDIIHLHNIHGHNCDLELLFNYIKTNNIKLFWTFHDCWAFTGYCPHYDMIGCDKWKSECNNCPQKGRYSWFFDKSKALHRKKKELFDGLDLTIITPSKWLADQVRQSFLHKYETVVINNGIDLDVFKPTESDFRIKYNLEDKYIVLGVAFGWGVRKGLDVFVKLAQHLDDNYRIVLVGTNDIVDKQLPDNIISIHKTNNQKELAEIYTAADVFVNATREENFPTVNMESIACGTPVITFDTGGSSEMVSEQCGAVVEKNDVVSLEKTIRDMCLNYSRERIKHDCLTHSRNFEEVRRFNDYINLYIS